MPTIFTFYAGYPPKPVGASQVLFAARGRHFDGWHVLFLRKQERLALLRIELCEQAIATLRGYEYHDEAVLKTLECNRLRSLFHEQYGYWPP